MRAVLPLEDFYCSEMEARLEGCQHLDREALAVVLLGAVGSLDEAESRGDGEKGMVLRDTELERRRQQC